MQPATLEVRTIGVMHKQEWQKCLILWYLHDTEQHLACCPKQRQVVGSIIFVNLIFGSEHKLRLQCMNQDPRDYVKSTKGVNSVFNTSRHNSASLAYQDQRVKMIFTWFCSCGGISSIWFQCYSNFFTRHFRSKYTSVGQMLRVTLGVGTVRLKYKISVLIKH